MKRQVVWIVAVGFAALGACGLRVVLEGRAALADGDAAIAAKHPAEAVAAWESAARWYLPAAPHVGEAYDRLRALAQTHRSIAAWRAIRSAARATRHLWQPHADDLAAADHAIAELAATDPERAPAATAMDRPAGSANPGDPDPARFVTWHAARLATDPRPSPGSGALAIAGIACWLAGIAALIRRQTPLTGSIAVAGVALWALGLYTA